MEVREVKNLIITLTHDEYQKYLIKDKSEVYFNFEKFISHIQMFNIKDILAFKINEEDRENEEEIIKINLKAIVK